MPESSFYARLSHLSAIISILPASMAGGWIVGYFVVDRYLSSFPWGSVIMTILGSGAGFYEIAKLLLRDQRENSK